MAKIQIKRGLEINLPILSIGELAYCTDSKKLFIGTPTGNERVNPVGSGSGTVEIIESPTNGRILVNDVEIDVYDDSTIITQLASKSTVSNSSNNGRIVVNGTEIDVFDDTEIINLLSAKASSEDVDQLNSALIGKADSTELESLQTIVENKADTSTLTTLQTTVSNKADRSELPNLTSLATLNKLSDNGTSLLFNNSPIGGGGGSAPASEYVLIESWSTTGSRTLSGQAVKIYVHNTGGTDLTFTVNGITVTAKADEEIEDIYDPFTQITITASGTFVAEASGLKVGSSNPLYSVKDSFSGTVGKARTLTGSCYGAIVSNDGDSSLSYTINGLTMSVSAGAVVEKSFNGFTQISVTSTVPYRVIVKSAYLSNVTGSDTDLTAPVITANSIGGSFNSDQTVMLSSDETATIYYTTNGVAPTTSSNVYSTPIVVSTTSTLKFFGKDTAGNESTVQTLTFTIDKIPPVVTISPPAGTFTSTQSVTLTSNDATIYYTTDGSTPTESSPVYSSAISVSSTKTVKYFAKDAFGNISTVQEAIYTITAGTYLSLNGLSDYLKVGTVATLIDNVEIEFEISSPTRAVILDFRAQLPNGWINNTSFGTGWTSVLLNDNPITTMASIPLDTKCVLKATASTTFNPQASSYIFANSSASIWQKGKLHKVTLRNGTTVKAIYDMSLGNVQDQSGNGNHATLIGGTWV